MCAKEAKMKKLQRKSVSERGSALIISLLVLMALTGLGAVAFTSAISGAQASRLRRSTAQASQITEGAMAAAVNALQCQSLADAIVQLATNSATRTAALEKNVDLQCRTTFVTGQDAESAYGVYSATSAGEQSGMQPAYYVTYRNPVDARHAAGSEVGKYCLKRLEVSVVGAVAPQIAEELLGSGQRALDTANDSSLGRSNAAGSMRSRMDAEVFAGPFSCSQTEK
jgi:Tfp pilus assembly protein PilX